jgi:hypothetical protein
VLLWKLIPHGNSDLSSYDGKVLTQLSRESL